MFPRHLLLHDWALLATFGWNNVSCCAVVHTIASNTRLADHTLGTITAPHQYSDRSNKIFNNAISVTIIVMSLLTCLRSISHAPCMQANTESPKHYRR